METRKLFISIVLSLITALISAQQPASAQNAPVVIKMATLAPKGTALAKAFEEMAQEIQDKTKGEVVFKTYWGGVQGDEKDVMRKIRLGQLHGGGFMGVGLGQVVPQVRVTEIPYVFRNYDEVAYVRGKLQPEMERLFEERGFKVLGWMDLGFVYIFSKVPLSDLNVARRQKWWALEGEPLSMAMFQALDISPVSLSISDVATSLSTNLIDCANSTPFGAVAFQWYTKFRYMTGYPSTNIQGATIVSKDVWNRISPASQKIVIEVARAKHKKIEQVTRMEDERSLELLKKSGIQIVKYDIKDKEMQYVFEAAKKARESLVGKVYSRELLERTLAYVEEYRRLHPEDTTVIRLDKGN
ncbi:MAG TPA: TRAP transporter substrate-binding protein DctP [Deltaproteobacteria bacterium]|nr:TRAP transporter substrate-binding protein DctP [Deltaproteobacteria bacterium]HOM28661.1 TRAP transporter substrate-binding protein DctP [Deltaproteobacteria bacterium]HPP80589.1 TRAP transporter substrate-binding protein DctP [Deltaproteobacteria bacterium]